MESAAKREMELSEAGFLGFAFRVWGSLGLGFRVEGVGGLRVFWAGVWG